MSDQDTGTGTPEDAETATDEGTRDAPGSTHSPDTDTGEGKGGKGGADALKADLVKERRQRQALEKRLKDIEDRDLTELQRAQRTAKEASDRLAQLEAETLRQRVALKHNIPAEHIHRLQGGTEAELAADAAELAKLLTPKAPRPDPSQGARNGHGGPVSMSQWVHEQLRSR